MDLWIEKWCSYNFASGSFYTKKLCSRPLSTEVGFYWQNSKIGFCATLRDTRFIYGSLESEWSTSY